MSKSLGNGIEPQDMMQHAGADVLRLWVAATDYANEMSVSRGDPQAHGGFLSAHAQHACASCSAICTTSIRRGTPCRSHELVALDRWALARTRRCRTRSSTAYRNYAFHLIYQKVHNFCVVDLGGFYLDILKDRLYTTPAREPRAPLGADGDVSHRREHGALAGADPVASPPRRCGATCRGERRRVGVPEHLARSCRRCPRERHRLAGVASRCAAMWRASSSGCAIAGQIGAPLDAERRGLLRRRRSSRASARWARSCASS